MEQINWKPVSFLPQIKDMINGMLDAAQETYEPLQQIKVHDDYTIKRIFEVTGEQVKDEWLYDEQLSRWMEDKNLKAAQRAEIQSLQEQMEKLKQVNRKILAIAEDHKGKTIEKIMSKSDAELGIEFLLGRPK